MIRPVLVRGSALLLVGALAVPVSAQVRLEQPMSSPRATVSQVVGITDVSVEYSRPGVKGRDVFANPQIVPFDAAQPWRAGADENTIVTFEHDCTVQGEPIAAGSYGVHVFPKSSGPWTVALSSNTTAWGSYSYQASEDVLRVTAEPRKGPFQERLEYEFQDLERDGATLVLRWAETELPLRVGVATDDLMVAYIRDDYLRGYGFWSAAQSAQAATWCVGAGVNLEEAEGWAQRAANAAPSFANWMLVAQVQDALGKTTAANGAREKAEPLATEAQRNALGYTLMQQGAVDRALAMFEKNVELYPASWNTYDSLAEACAAAGQTDRAVELYGKALEMVTDDANKQRIEGVLRTLQG